MEEKLDNMSSTIQYLCSQIPRTPDNASDKDKKTNPKKTTRVKERYTSRPATSNEEDSDFHVEVLKDEHKLLMDNITLQDNMLDLLVENEAIYQSDSEEIMSFSNRSERVRCLLLILSRNDNTKFMGSIEALKQEKREDLANILLLGYEKYRNGKTGCKPKCVHCKIKSRVDLKKVIDNLYQERVIDYSFLERVNKSKLCARKILWDECFYIIRKSGKADFFPSV
ncbi:uncharacterized protein LOC134274992 [Saccostrea cucullata]|uniref:uncharacterized protein LOC134274992 n=1 Tax=Saccostrea cuccullata TaxID=36930 RepID=UPI002ED3EC72